MALSKRVRYEVLRRDNHTCRYCGGAAPDVVLTVDHVVPVALGGGDGPENLVTACKDCNAGKTSSAPDAGLVADVQQDALRWAAAIKKAGAELGKKNRGTDASAKAFLKAWNVWSFTEMLPDDWHRSVHQWLSSGLPLQVLIDDIDIAMRADYVKPVAKFTYLAGIANSQIRELHRAARASLSSTEG